MDAKTISQIITDPENQPHQYTDDPIIGKSFIVTFPDHPHKGQEVKVLTINEWDDCEVLLFNGEIFRYNLYWLKPVKNRKVKGLRRTPRTGP